MAGSSADPQAGALARLTSRDEATVRTALALFLAGLIEAGSALGFTLVTVATRTSPPLPAPTSAPRSSEVTRRRVGSPRLGSVNGANAVAAWTKLPASAPSNAPTSKEASCRRVDPPQLATAKDAIGRWALTRLAIDPTTEVPARAAYEDFCCWSRAQGLEPCSETRFGVIFTAHIGGLGGRKVKRRDRAYYVGVSLAGACIPPALSRSEYTTSIKTERRVLGPCQVAAAQRRRWGRWCTKQRVEEQQVPK